MIMLDAIFYHVFRKTMGKDKFFYKRGMFYDFDAECGIIKNIGAYLTRDRCDLQIYKGITSFADEVKRASGRYLSLNSVWVPGEAGYPQDSQTDGHSRIMHIGNVYFDRGIYNCSNIAPQIELQLTFFKEHLLDDFLAVKTPEDVLRYHEQEIAQHEGQMGIMGQRIVFECIQARAYEKGLEWAMQLKCAAEERRRLLRERGNKDEEISPLWIERDAGKKIWKALEERDEAYLISELNKRIETSRMTCSHFFR